MQLNACYVTTFRLAFLPRTADCNPLGDWLLFRNQSPMLDGVESTQIDNWLLMADNWNRSKKARQGIRSLRRQRLEFVGSYRDVWRVQGLHLRSWRTAPPASPISNTSTRSPSHWMSPSTSCWARPLRNRRGKAPRKYPTYPRDCWNKRGSRLDGSRCSNACGGQFSGASPQIRKTGGSCWRLCAC